MEVSGLGGLAWTFWKPEFYLHSAGIRIPDYPARNLVAIPIERPGNTDMS